MTDHDLHAVRAEPTIDRELLAAWFDAHAPALAAHAARRVGADLARDVVADTFRFAFEQRDRFDPGRGDPRAWLFGIATNLIRRHWRTERRRLQTQARALDSGLTAVDRSGTPDVARLGDAPRDRRPGGLVRRALGHRRPRRFGQL